MLRSQNLSLKLKIAVKMFHSPIPQVKTRIHQQQVNLILMCLVKQNFKRQQVKQIQICSLRNNVLWFPMAEDDCRVAAILCLIHPQTRIYLLAIDSTSRHYIKAHGDQIKEIGILKWCKLHLASICPIGGLNISKLDLRLHISSNMKILPYLSKIAQTRKDPILKILFNTKL